MDVHKLMGRKCSGKRAGVRLGTSITRVSFQEASILPELKNSWTAFTVSEIVRPQSFVKNEYVTPSNPGVLFWPKEKTVSLISFSSGIEVKCEATDAETWAIREGKLAMLVSSSKHHLEVKCRFKLFAMMA